jgi:ATP/maltotriose-dependent transcriptional regulator MalT
LGWLMVTHGDMRDGHAFLDESIHLARTYDEFRMLASALGMKAQALGSNVTWEIIAELEEVIERCRAPGYEQELVLALFSVGQAYLTKGESKRGQRAVTEVVGLVEKYEVRYIQAWVYTIQAIAARLAGNISVEERYYLLAIEASEKLGNHRLAASARSDLGHLYRQEGRHEEALAMYRQTILSWQEQGHQAAVAHQLECFAYLAIARGSYTYAAQLLGAAHQAREQNHSPSTEPVEIREKEQALDALAAGMGREERDRFLEKGKWMSLDEAVAMAREPGGDSHGEPN